MSWNNQQTKNMEIARGVHLVKYISAQDQRSPPRISIGSSQSEIVEVVLPPDTDEAVLWCPGAALVVRAFQSATLEVTVTPRRRGGDSAVQIQVTPLSSDPSNLSGRKRYEDVLDLAQLRVLAHVAGLGDIFAGTDEWIAGPTAPSRIEGLAIQWPNIPRNFQLRYAARLGGPRPTTTPWISAGDFVGSRGRAVPLVGLQMEISGIEASNYRLSVHALFLSSPQIHALGQRVTLSGPTGREPLVGVKFSVELAPDLQSESLPLKSQVNTTSASFSEAESKASHSRQEVSKGKSGIQVFRSENADHSRGQNLKSPKRIQSKTKRKSEETRASPSDARGKNSAKRVSGIQIFRGSNKD